MRRLSVWIITIIIIGCIAIAAVIGFALTYYLGSIHGRLTVRFDDSVNTYSFSAPGDYGDFEWIVGPEDTPFKVTLFNRNSWHIINMDFVAEREMSSWHITGIINVKTYEPRTYEKTISDSEPLVIAVDCFP